MKRKGSSRQINLFEGYENLRKDARFGGALTGKNNAKEKRPFSAKHPMHIVLRSSMAVGKRSLLGWSRRIQDELNAQAKKHFVEIKSFANAGNHLHLIVHCTSRSGLTAFLRGFSSTVARIVLGIKRGQSKMAGLLNPEGRNNRFWDFIPWSTILNCYTAVRNGMKYLRLNTIEVTERIDRMSARERLAKIKIFEQSRMNDGDGLMAFGFDC